MVRAFYSQANERLPQYQTEKVLRAKMDKLAERHLLLRLDGKVGRAGRQRRAHRRSSSTTDRGREVLEADYAVGCDGARSLVRDQIGIERSGTDFDQLMVLLVFRSRDLHEALKQFPPSARPIA